ncbi:uncharacterized protein METZ01_LOCUS230069, partial [marine metagenome]
MLYVDCPTTLYVDSIGAPISVDRRPYVRGEASQNAYERHPLTKQVGSPPGHTKSGP